jgi:hypothetical protein
MSKNTGTSELINYFDLGANGDVGIAGSLDVNTIANATTDTDKFLVSDTGIIKYRTGAELLTDIGAAPSVAGGYVPYSGANSNVDLGIYNLTANAVNVNGSGSNAGVINLESNTFFSLVNGYGTIGSGTTNQFNFYQTTGAGVFRGAIFSLNSITASATRTFTLPDADGTIALTSSLSGYLPLTGGTLTGALNGTSATFSGADLTVTGASTQPFLRVSRTGTGARSYYWGINGGSTLFLQDETAGATRITLTAANVMTLSSDVIVTGTLNSGALTGTNATFTGNILLSGSGAYVRASTTNGFLVNNNIDTLNLFIVTNAGNVGIGTTTPSAKLQLGGFSGAVNQNNGIKLTNNVGTIVGLEVGGSNDSYIGTISASNFSIRTANTPILTVSSGGNVLIGTTTDAGYKFDVLGASGNITSDMGNGTIINIDGGSITSTNFGVGIGFVRTGSQMAYIKAARENASDEAGYLAFATQTGAGLHPERMRITSKGYLKASSNGSYVSSTGTYHEFNSSANDEQTIAIRHTGSAPYGIYMDYTGASPNNTSKWFAYFADSTALRFEIRSNGGISNYQANDTNLSDERTKKDIEPLESYWDKFKAIDIVKFKYIDQTHDDFNIGVIAQQVEAVAPEFVDIDGWGTKPKLDEEGNEIVSEEEPLKAIYTADLYHATIKVLQEAMAKIEKLEVEIDKLKNV